MIRRLVAPDAVTATGALLGLASFGFGWLTLKPDRLSSGASLSFWQSAGWGGPAVVLLLWLICLAASFTGRGRLRALVSGSAANLALVTSFWLAGVAATGLLRGQGEFARVSLGVGIWLTVAAVYMVIFASRQALPGSPAFRHLLSWSGPVLVALFFLTGQLDHLSVVQEFIANRERFGLELVHHVFLVGVSVAVGTVLGVALGIWATRSAHAERPVFFLANIAQTIPSLALFGLLIAPLSALSFAFPVLREIGIRGVGNAPAIIALVIYSLLPITRNTCVGLRQVESAVIDAGRGMGMSRRQVFRRIEVPLAAPLVLEGVRTASVQSVGLAAVAALIGAGGLGWFVFRGLGQAANDLILVGALPIIIIALVVDAVMRYIVRAATPRGLEKSHDTA